MRGTEEVWTATASPTLRHTLESDPAHSSSLVAAATVAGLPISTTVPML